VRYAARAALEGVSLAVLAGTCTGVIGPNGSGKSTLVRALSGALRRYEGSVLLDGRELRSIPPREVARALAVVPQESTVTLPFTALEVVLLGRHPHVAGIGFEGARDVEAARAALEEMGALGLADRPVHELSTGERQRVAIARALAQEPRILLLDEPSAALDIRSEVELFDRVRARVAGGRTGALVVLHDLNLAAERCDRLVLLHEGRVLASGPTAEVLRPETLERGFGIALEAIAVPGRAAPVIVPRRA
jgi:iron complex transport system ATP-binding protein